MNLDIDLWSLHTYVYKCKYANTKMCAHEHMYATYTHKHMYPRVHLPPSKKERETNPEPQRDFRPYIPGMHCS